MTGLVTRPPAGRPSWPLVLIEGPERAGKLALAVGLAADERVGRVLVLDVTGQADELEGGHEVVETNGTYGDLVDKVRAATELPAVDGRPNVVVVDGTELWELLKRWVDAQARLSKTAQRALADDPHASIDAPSDVWIRAKDRWAEVIGLLRRFPGIGIVTAVSGEQPRYLDGEPVAGESVWTVQAEKTITRSASVWVRVLRHPHRMLLMAATSLPETATYAEGCPIDGGLATVLFGVLGDYRPHTAPAATVGVSAAAAKRQLLDTVGKVLDLADSEKTAEAVRLWDASGITSPEVTPAELEALLATVGQPPADPEPDPGPDPDPVLVARGEAP